MICFLYFYKENLAKWSTHSSVLVSLPSETTSRALFVVQ